MVPVAADHAADVINGYVLPGLATDVLPAGDLLEHKQADLVAGIEKMARLRIVRGAHDVAVQFVPQDVSIATLHTRRHGLPHPGKGLVAIEAVQLHHVAVQ